MQIESPKLHQRGRLQGAPFENMITDVMK